jgi:hypothetical protein
MGLRSTLKTVEPVIQHFKTVTNHSIILFGELHGGNIQKVIKYGEKRILFFDMMLDDELLSYVEFFNIMRSNGLESHIVPVLAVVVGLDAALNYPCEFQSKLCTDQAEGIVIKPYFTNYKLHGEIFYLKKKIEKFAEKTPTEKKERTVSPLIPYINENRMNSVFSKEGRITAKTDMSRYIKLILADAVKDYEKDNPDTPLPEDDKRLGNLAARLLLKEL